jgi:hypothetical protein
MSLFRVTKTRLAERVRDLVLGTQKHSPNGSLMLGGQSFTSQSLTQEFQSLGDALAKADAAKAYWLDTLKQLDDTRARVVPLVGAYRGWLSVTYGNSTAILADYGLSPRKAPLPLTTEQQAAAVAKRAATRAARHTMGPRQKKVVKGNVTGVVLTPVTAPPPVATPAAAPSTTPATNGDASVQKRMG